MLQLRRAAMQVVGGGEDGGVDVLDAELGEVVGDPVPEVQDVEAAEARALLEGEDGVAEQRQLDGAAQADGPAAEHHRLEGGASGGDGGGGSGVLAVREALV